MMWRGGLIVVSCLLALCAFSVAETIVSDDFEGDTPGEVPSGWVIDEKNDITYVTGEHEALVFDDTTHGLVLGMLDTVTRAPGGPFIDRNIDPQSGQFTLEFDMVPKVTGEVFVRLYGDAGATIATGLGNGLGTYSNGKIGFNSGDTLTYTDNSQDVTYTLDTLMHYTVEVDVEAGVFSVLIDGRATSATDRALGLAADAIDQIEFGTSASIVGTAYIDNVTVDAPATLGFKMRNCILKDSEKKKKDFIRVNGTFTVPDGEALLDPETENLTIVLGDQVNPITIEIPAGDKGWKSNKNHLRWKNKKGKDGKIQIKFNVKKGKFQLKAMKLDWDAPQENPIGISITTALGTAEAYDEWRDTGKGIKKYP
jgi:hypothetical protein